MNNTVLLDPDGPIATLALNRPEALNALHFDMVAALVAQSAAIAAVPPLGVVIPRGAPRR